MASMDRDGFPITLWPGVPIPDPAVVRMDAKPLGERVSYSGLVEQASPLPEEFVLRELLDLDLGDGPTPERVESMCEFLSTWGMLARPFPALTVEGNETDGRHVMDVWCWLRTAQALVDTWRRHHLDEYLLPAWDGGPVRVLEEGDVWVAFVEWLNIGLGAMPMHATVQLELPDEFGPFTYGTPELGLYSACCIQLANLVNEAMPPHRCANETCGRAFVRQRGGAEQGQYRTVGVLYCSPGCQRAQASRVHRRKVAAAKRQQSTKGKGSR